MDDFENIMRNINIPTNMIRADVIQEILLKAKQSTKKSVDKEYWNEVSKILWQHLKYGLNKFDDQLLCATCFYTVLILTDSNEKVEYFKEIAEIINNEINIREKDNSKTFHAVSLMYGLFQSAFLTQNASSNIPNLLLVLEVIFELLVIMAYEYSRYTYIVFKTMNSFKKVFGTELQGIIFSVDNQVTLLNLVNHNWENPITGVRDFNKTIFQTLMSVVDEVMFKTILEETKGFYWNKAKYLMISEIIDKYTNNFCTFMKESDWIDGLMNSLHKPGLVSAGADMYFSVVKKLRSEDEWCTIFLSDVIKLLNGLSIKAIENFGNYWCITTLKTFPSLIHILNKELDSLQMSEHKLFSSLFIAKQANKLGLISKNWTSVDKCKDFNKMVLDGLQNCNTHMRILAFDILCVSQGKTMPNEVEYELVLSFLRNNVNSDCTVLRLSMFNSLSSFLVQLNVTFLNNRIVDQSGDIYHLQEFCKHLQDFLITSVNIGNYQRKITCIKLANIFLSDLKEVPRKRQKQTNLSNNTIIMMIEEKGQLLLLRQEFITKLLTLLKDPADDIRESVILLLLKHYSEELRKTSLMNHIIEEALKCMKSKFFYEISCGRSMFKLIINILIREKHAEAIFKSAEEIVDYAATELLSEYKLKRSIIESIEKGRQLNSFMNILQVALEICYHNEYNIDISHERMSALLDALEGISNQFAWEHESSTSSDFSKISDMVQDIISKAGHNPCDVNDYTKISGLQQIVLNSLWLNVKASCDLSSVLIRLQRDDSGIDIYEKSLSIITHVLETCRHKGAIEAAGTCLGQCIQHLTSLPEELNISQLPHYLLKCKLEELILEANKMASVTRRGAGLSIMVHRIVSNDTKRGKSLFHYFMNTLLKTCNCAEDIPNLAENNKNIDNEKDLPKAIYIHFLTKIVTDSSLASDMMFYSAKLAEIAFGNLISPHWQIRNAALQLYGALVPKLIGQKKASGSNDETVATVACDELRTHSRLLWQYIQEQLKNNDYTDKLQYHSNLLPILNMLANIARRYNFTYDTIVHQNADESLLRSLMLLLDSPIYTVRRLTATCIFNIYTFPAIYDILLKQECISENFLHGSLMLIANYYKVCYHYYRENFNNLRIKFNTILNSGEHSYLCKMLYEDLFYDGRLNMDVMRQTLLEMDSNVYAPGIVLWANARFHKLVQCFPWVIIPEMLNLVLDRKDFNQYCELLMEKIENEECPPEDVLIDIANILLSYRNKFKSSLVWQILYQISLRIELSKNIDLSLMKEYLEGTNVPYKLRYIIPLMARICSNAENEIVLVNISRIIFSLIESESTDVDMRYIAATSNNEFGPVFRQLPEPVKINSIKSAVLLLQDEDEDIRKLSVEFYKHVANVDAAPHPYICLLNFLDSKFLTIIVTETAFEVICNDLEDVLLKISNNKSTDLYNPFANDSKNIYLEVGVLTHLVENLRICK